MLIHRSNKAVLNRVHDWADPGGRSGQESPAALSTQLGPGRKRLSHDALALLSPVPRSSFWPRLGRLAHSLGAFQQSFPLVRSEPRMETTYPILCAWCGTTTGQGVVPHSHGICRSCRAALLGIPLLSEAQLGDLPFGVIELDPKGLVLIYNKAEENLSGMASSSVVGKNFFREVAPCTSVKKFEGRYLTFISSRSDPESFNFTFRFPGRNTKVSIAFVRSERGTAFVLVKARTEILPGA